MNKVKIFRKAVAFSLCVVMLLSGCSFQWEQDAGMPAQGPEDETTTTYTPPKENVITLPSQTQNVEKFGDAEAVNEDVTQTDVFSWDDSALGGYAVSSSSSEATWAGMYVLSQGGNAIDAAAAVAFTLGVTEPYSSGLGGSGFMLVYDTQTGESWTLDYYGCAGNAASSSDGVAVPGLLMGMSEAIERWGNLTLADALEVAIYYAENGFYASKTFVSRLQYDFRLKNNVAYADVEEGDLVIQTELAQTMRRIQSEGIDLFYSGDIAKDIAAASSLTVTDLSSYEVQCTEALETEVYGYQVFTANAPASGLTVAQMLKMSEQMDIVSPQEDTPGYLRVLNTVTAKAYDDRLTHVVDPAFGTVDTQYYASDEYIEELMGQSTSGQEGEGEQYCTTSYSVIDGNGLIVCVTNTLSDNWGSYQYVDGFYLNNTLSNFSSIGINGYEPGKRPRSYISPTIVVGNDGFCLAVGSPGGDNIPRVIVPVVLDIIKFGTDVQTAVDKGRVFCDTDGTVCIESTDGNKSMVDTTQITGEYYYSSQHIYFGCTSIVGYDPDDGFISACDRRRGGAQAMIYSSKK